MATDERADRIEALAGKLGLPRAALEDSDPALFPPAPAAPPPSVPFADPDPYRELRYPSVLAGKLAIADYLGFALAKLLAVGPRLRRRTAPGDAGPAHRHRLRARPLPRPHETPNGGGGRGCALK